VDVDGRGRRHQRLCSSHRSVSDSRSVWGQVHLHLHCAPSQHRHTLRPLTSAPRPGPPLDFSLSLPPFPVATARLPQSSPRAGGQGRCVQQAVLQASGWEHCDVEHSQVGHSGSRTAEHKHVTTGGLWKKRPAAVSCLFRPHSLPVLVFFLHCC